jgi:hypothetical protein
MFQNVLLVLLQLCLAGWAFAAPIADETVKTASSTPWQYGAGGGVIGFIVLVMDLIVFGTLPANLVYHCWCQSDWKDAN